MNDTRTVSRGKMRPVDSTNGQDELDLPPQDLETERCVLGCLLLVNESFAEVSPIVDVDCFYSNAHRLIFRAFEEMHTEQGGGIDPVTLRDELTRRGELQDAGGVNYLHTILETVPHTSHAGYYAKIVREKSDRRKAAEIGRELVRCAYDQTEDIDGIKAKASTAVQSLGTGNKAGRTFAGIDSAELTVYASQEPDWLVEGVFTSDEPLLFGARSKGCKTLQLTDLAVALATGTPWMGTFEVPRQRRVLFISGETNNRRMAKHIENACRARGGTFADLGDRLRMECVDFPSLPSASDLAAITRTISSHQIEVVIVDPLYRGMAGVDASQLSEMGSAIKGFQAACQPACVILSHHVVKSAAREYGTPPQLEDMTGAGVAESCGQWWLVGRNEAYAWDGQHDLCVSFGGREGQAGGMRILFDERAWTFDMERLSDFRASADEERREQKEKAKRDTESRMMNQARSKIVSACRNIKSPQSKTGIKDASGVTRDAFGPAFSELVSEQTLLMRPYIDSLGRNQTSGYILTEYATEYDEKWGAE